MCAIVSGAGAQPKLFPVDQKRGGESAPPLFWLPQLFKIGIDHIVFVSSRLGSLARLACGMAVALTGLGRLGIHGFGQLMRRLAERPSLDELVESGDYSDPVKHRVMLDALHIAGLLKHAREAAH